MRNTLLLDSYPLIVIPELAQAIGLNEAIVLQQVHYWCLHNKNAGNNYRDGYYWVYNSYREWQKQFPWWSERTIKSIISRLETKGLLVSGNYNKLRMDRTKWYRLDYEALTATISNTSLGNSCTMDSATLTQAIPETNRRTNNGIKEEWNSSSAKCKQKLSAGEDSAQSSAPLVDSCNTEMSAFVDWYFDCFVTIFGYNHPNIKADQKRRIIKTLDEFAAQNDLDIDALKEMAIAFFDNVEDSDHNINHFATYGILENRYYEAIY